MARSTVKTGHYPGDHHVGIYHSPVGQGWVVSSPAGVVRVELPGMFTPLPEVAVLGGPSSDDEHLKRPEAGAVKVGTAQAGAAQARTHLKAAQTWLEDHLNETLHDAPCPALPALVPKGTAFQRAVWQAIASLPKGRTTTYGELAAHLGRPGAARAVGAACGANPLPLFIPCHRVLAADGGLGGFAGGLDLKRWLLRHEGLAVD